MSGFSMCIKCKEGYIIDKNGDCRESCPSNSYFDFQRSICVNCPPGTFYNSKKKTCSECPNDCNTCTPSLDQAIEEPTCLSCPIDKVLEKQENRCRSTCDKGAPIYNPETRECEMCKSGTYVNENTLSCESCPSNCTEC